MPRQYLREFEIAGRRVPTTANRDPEVYKMRIFAPNYVVAKSRFWYHMRQMKSLKATAGEIVNIKEVRAKTPGQVKNYELNLKVYNRKVGFINTRKEYRDVTRAGAVSQAFIEMASRNRNKFQEINVISAKTVPASKLVSPASTQFLGANVKFPLCHRVPRMPMTFTERRPRTY
eukprot:PhM_4_TR16055/c0_g1_i1/m.98499/K02882/RP-L18Ae, RPL18A; large subunit ribosomal protein L18Ae